MEFGRDGGLAADEIADPIGRSLRTYRRCAAALDELIEVVRRDRGAQRERARKSAIALFGLAADQPDLVGESRRKLSGALY